ncbi:hypothetical protein BBO99_00006722, partial [Phytophthora kernoviae]
FIGGIEFEDERIPFEDVPKMSPALPFNQIPVLEVDGEVVSQSMAILRYAGSLSDLYPTTNALTAHRVDEILSLFDEMFGSPDWRASSKEQDSDKRLEISKALAKDAIPKAISLLEKRLADFNSQYAVGEDLTVADLTVYTVVLNLTSGKPGIPSTITDPYPNVQRVFNQVKVLQPQTVVIAMSGFPNIKLTYFAAAGRAEAQRLVFYLGGVPFEDKRINHQQFTAMKESLPLGQVPILEVDGEIFTQSHAIMRYAGRVSGLYPNSTPYLALKIDELLHAMAEVEEQMGPSFYESDADKKKAMREELAATTLPRYARLIEARLEKMQQLPAFQSDKVYVHDVAIYAWVKSLRAGYIDSIPTTVLDGYKLLNSTYERVAAHPKVKEWYSLQHNIPKLKFTYMPHPGRGEPIRLAFFIGGIEFEDERITREELASRKPSLPFNQLPVLEVDGDVIAQSLAILRYAGTLSGLYPVTDALVAYRIDELFAILDDMFNYPVWGLSHREKDTAKQLAMREELANGMVPKTLGFLENRVAKNKGAYAAGESLTVADLAIYALLLSFKSGVPGFPTTIADSYVNLQGVFKLVAAHPKVVEWNAAHNQ